MIKLRLVCALLAGGLASVAQTPEYGYQVIHVYPHDPNAFTQGLEFRAGFLYESTGLKGRSSVRRRQLETGKVLQQIEIDPQLFRRRHHGVESEDRRTHLAVGDRFRV